MRTALTGRLGWNAVTVFSHPLGAAGAAGTRPASPSRSRPPPPAPPAPFRSRTVSPSAPSHRCLSEPCCGNRGTARCRPQHLGRLVVGRPRAGLLIAALAVTQAPKPGETTTDPHPEWPMATGNRCPPGPDAWSALAGPGPGPWTLQAGGEGDRFRGGERRPDL